MSAEVFTPSNMPELIREAVVDNPDAKKHVMDLEFKGSEWEEAKFLRRWNGPSHAETGIGELAMKHFVAARIEKPITSFADLQDIVAVAGELYLPSSASAKSRRGEADRDRLSAIMQQAGNMIANDAGSVGKTAQLFETHFSKKALLCAAQDELFIQAVDSRDISPELVSIKIYLASQGRCIEAPTPQTALPLQLVDNHAAKKASQKKDEIFEETLTSFLTVRLPVGNRELLEVPSKYIQDIAQNYYEVVGPERASQADREMLERSVIVSLMNSLRSAAQIDSNAQKMFRYLANAAVKYPPSMHSRPLPGGMKRPPLAAYRSLSEQLLPQLGRSKSERPLSLAASSEIIATALAMSLEHNSNVPRRKVLQDATTATRMLCHRLEQAQQAVA